MRLEWLGQFAFRLPTAPLEVHPWRVEAYYWSVTSSGFFTRTSSGRWVLMPRHTRPFSGSSSATTYFNSMCAMGRRISPTGGGRNFPVKVRLIREGVTVKECSR